MIAHGVEHGVFEWGRELRGLEPTIVLLHATGFHARVWDQTVALLGARHIVAIDQRGHGRSENTPFDTWLDFGRDLISILEQLEVSGAIGVGHSMGGHATVLAAAEAPQLFSRLVLFDPVIMPPAFYEGTIPSPGGRGEEDHPTAKRRSRFENPEAMIERFAQREPFSLFTPEALADYCVYGLLPATDGDGFELACPPAFEASVYMSARNNPGVYDSVRKVEVPVRVIRAQEPPEAKSVANFAYSPTWPALADEFPNATDRYCPDHTHFFPMQDPELTARMILAD